MIPEDLLQKVGYCGLYCANCGQYRRGKCTGCRAGGGFGRCAVRKCCVDLNIATCAGCTEFEQLADCKKLNNFISKVFSLIFRTDRLGNLAAIRENGLESWIAQMSGSDKP